MPRRRCPDYVWIAAAAVCVPLLSGCSTSGWSAARSSSRAPVSNHGATQQVASNQAPPANATQADAAQLVVVHGSVGYWPGCDDFVANLAARGAPATTIRGWEVKRTADKIVASRQVGTPTGPLVLIGYGRGANDALRLARRLQESDIPVTKLVLLETASNDSVPGNVESCLNIYQSSSDEWVPAFRGLPITVESANTQLVNYNLRFHDEGIARTDLSRFTVCKNYAVLGMVTDHVTAALRREDAPLRSPEDSASQVAAARADSTRATFDERFLPFE